MVEGRIVVAPLLADGDWAALRDVAVRMACCRAEGYPRTSERGTRHFVHLRTGDCAWAPESETHLAAKAEIATACAAAGWDVQTEAAGEGWRADVLAARGAVRAAFEVQVSPITREELEHRQRRYERDGVSGWWVVAEPPAGVAERVPVFRLAEDGARLTVDGVGLGAWTGAVLGGAVGFAPRVVAAREQVVAVAFVEARCGSCRAVNHLFAADRYRSACGRDVWPGPSGDELDRVAWMRLRPEIGDAVRRVPGVKVGPVRPVHDAHGRSYLAHGCVMCGRPFGHAEFRAAARQALAGEVVARHTVAVRAAGARSAGAHWCAGAQRCR